MGTRRWLAVALCVLLSWALAACERGGSPEQASGERGCDTPEQAKQRDIDRSDSRETPFRRTRGELVRIEIENANLRPDLWRHVQRAVSIWDDSPCLSPVAVDECADRMNCLTIRAYPAMVLRRIEPGGGWADSDGAFSGRGRDGHRVGGRVSLNLDFFDRMSENGQLATIVHELGHAFGLRHRQDRRDVMHAVTGNRTDPQPDRIDFHNLVVIYGGRVIP